jgi:hypothetical protein
LNADPGAGVLSPRSEKLGLLICGLIGMLSIKPSAPQVISETMSGAGGG